MGSSHSAIHSLIRRAARAYVSGPAIADAGEVCDRLAREGIAGTVCYWDAYASHPNLVSQAYLGVRGGAGSTSDWYISAKAQALNFDMKLVKKILSEADRLKAVVYFDATGPDTVDRTFELIGSAREIYPNLGCALPGRWRRSLEDADRAIDLRLRVRVVKGEWPAPACDESDPREGFFN